ncbi:helix-turn-helix domain-containing protein [Lactiplantibacillus songbeiensis]|uniref:Helix-turn-helix domain-containing protein n=1 Tax=Lactiplantibacillus songbeiensis TaxID=2559920 RepID=A0ABW4C3E8_9LACO|nr:helix-turn-helix transcriptional regulator [Lactiplantibacillus songbeiensis]
MNNQTTIANIQAWLLAHERSQKWLAEKLVITPALISQILNGKRKLQTQQLIKISKIIGVPLAELTASPQVKAEHQPQYELRGHFSKPKAQHDFEQLLWDVERYVDLKESIHD